MSLDAWSPKPTQPHKSLESLKQTFKQRLDVILGKQLTVENISTFADEALSETIKLTEDALKEYRDNPNVYPSQIPLDKQIQENEAFTIFGLPNISEILQSIIDVRSKIDALGKYINENNIITNKVVIPPQHDSLSPIRNGAGTGIEEKKLIPRLITLLYILETDFDIPKEQVRITEGKVSPEMMRKTPYVRIEISDLERVVYICDEEGNASYVFDTEKLSGVGITTENLDIENKGNLNDLIVKHPGIGARIIQTKNWRINVAELLENPIPEKIQNTEKTPELRKSASEFAKKERKEYLSFEDLQNEVKILYPGKGEAQKWYRKERSNHANWPYSPDIIYKSKGWQDWSEFVGRENHLKKEFLSFEHFQAEVRNLYPGKGEIVEWYRKEVRSKKHKDWPSSPDHFYKNIGWKSWPELIGKEKEKNKDFLTFADFKNEVRRLYKLYQGKLSDFNWYKIEKPSHPNWPANPDSTYKDSGWVSWPNLFDRKSQNDREFLSFTDLQAEIAALYPGSKGMAEWYRSESKNHPNWPSNPNLVYKNKGWKNWPDLVGNKKE